jgi:hypothetical protein
MRWGIDVDRFGQTSYSVLTPHAVEIADNLPALNTFDTADRRRREERTAHPA